MTDLSAISPPFAKGQGKDDSRGIAGTRGIWCLTQWGLQTNTVRRSQAILYRRRLSLIEISPVHWILELWL